MWLDGTEWELKLPLPARRCNRSNTRIKCEGESPSRGQRRVSKVGLTWELGWRIGKDQVGKSKCDWIEMWTNSWEGHQHPRSSIPRVRVCARARACACACVGASAIKAMRKIQVMLYYLFTLIWSCLQGCQGVPHLEMINFMYQLDHSTQVFSQTLV